MDRDADTVRSFFRRHGAVAADDRGPQWDTAAESVLLDWCASQCKAWDEQPAAQPELLPTLKDLRRETWQRLQRRPPDKIIHDEYRPLLAAWYGICVRIGFGGDR